ncbi:hypothetical protein FRB94_002114 [Tulasnella sp. JGI-2019a]|nr:hypothetical protein FRB93_009120 [Tulasnella sp. JGI-2019a]KAG9013520.1 hypothetical protein FRB94_002114 [Tulasnella sp. JGI-2019a]KAG9037217.1 hypothetical protein FRB95_006470 [Tulasnella sp. JGI-2019a]
MLSTSLQNFPILDIPTHYHVAAQLKITPPVLIMSKKAFRDPYFGPDPDEYDKYRPSSSNRSKKQSRKRSQSTSITSSQAARPLINPQTNGPYVLVPPPGTATYVHPSNTGLVYTSPDHAYRGQRTTSDGRLISYLHPGPGGELIYSPYPYGTSPPLVQSPMQLQPQPQLVQVTGGFAGQPQVAPYPGAIQPYNTLTSPRIYPIQQQLQQQFVVPTYDRGGI